ncbi:M28 family peptidase [candidate division KSB1 bacterium]
MKLKKILILPVLFFAFSVLAQKIPENALKSITSQELFDHVKYLASDEMRGRDTPSPELKKCAEYIANEFKSYGLTSTFKNTDYFQVFNCLKNKLDMTETGNGLPNKFAIIDNGKKEEFVIKSDFLPHFLTSDGEITAEIVFAGYGITAPEYKYDDYKNIDVKGKIVLVMRREPQEKDSTSIFAGKAETSYSKTEYKYKNAVNHGAAGFMIVRAPSEAGRRPPMIWPSLMRRSSGTVPLTLDLGKGSDIPAVFIHKTIADRIVQNSGKTLKQIQAEIDKDFVPRSFAVTQLKVHITSQLIRTKLPTQNVIAFIEGSDPVLKNEVVIMCAHYDHIGVRNDSIYNGADDNASGTAGVMELAEAFSKCEKRPKRSLLFMAFAGEEKGLFGARFYAANPMFPLKKTAAVLNIDMMGRNDPNEITLIGTEYNPDLKAISVKANEQIGLNLEFIPQSPFVGSDHQPFRDRLVPVLWYYSKDSGDTHQPTDDYFRILPGKMEKVTRLVFVTAWLAANTDKMPEALPYQ